YIVYHRRPLGTADGNHRQIAIDRMHFRGDGSIAPVVITQEGVGPQPLRGA
ncbi:MAG: arabinan endo-1,5-alpha-L-arabinosidase, partial [Sphingomonadales bacterium]